MHVRWGRFAAYVSISAGLLALAHWAFERAGIVGGDRVSLLVTAGIVLVIAAPFGIVRGGHKTLVPKVREVAPDTLSPYRGGPPRAKPRVLPRVSGKAAAVGLLAAFSITALALPFALHRARWVEVEVVFAAWWSILATLLAALLYRGARVDDDHSAPWNDETSPEAKGAERIAPRRKSRFLDWFDVPDLSGFADAGEGCLGILVGIALAIVALVAAWVLIEFVVPAVFFVAYILFVRAIARVANDRHGCEGDLGRAAMWGAVWSAAYVGPLAILVAIVHAILRARHGFGG